MGLIVTCTQPYKKVVFTWTTNEDCDFIAVGVSDEEVDALISARAHEGCDVQGWNVAIS